MLDLFGNDVKPVPDKAKGKRLAELQHKQLLTIHGTTEGQKCGNCIHLKGRKGGYHTYWKCLLASMSHSIATDWRCRWQACGKFESIKEEKNETNGQNI